MSCLFVEDVEKALQSLEVRSDWRMEQRRHILNRRDYRGTYLASEYLLLISVNKIFQRHRDTPPPLRRM
jgi:hypothetical protein